MLYVKLYFNKEIDSLTFEDIEDFFILPKDESNKIEFKSYHYTEEKNHTEKENGIMKTICGLLNSEGGIVIWGAPKGTKVPGKKEKVFQGDLSLVEKIIEKDEFITKVADSITPSPTGVNFIPLQKEGKYVYIIEVERSFYAPHQFRNIYYMRIDGQTRPAPHHYIEALFRKITFPKLEGYMRIVNIYPHNDKLRLQLKFIILNKSKYQNEYDVYCRFYVYPGVFANFDMIFLPNRNHSMGGHELAITNSKPILYYNDPLINNESIDIGISDIANAEFKCKVKLFFGGKQSPLMTSEYDLLLKDIPTTKDFDGLIIFSSVNRFTSEND